MYVDPTCSLLLSTSQRRELKCLEESRTSLGMDSVSLLIAAVPIGVVGIGVALYLLKRRLAHYTLSWKTLGEYLHLTAKTKTAQYFDNGVLSSTRASKTYDLSYHVGEKKYIVRFPKKLGMCSFSKVYDGDVDVTENVKKFAGPSHNFHGIATTPMMLGYDNGLRFIYRTQEEIFYKPYEIIPYL